MTPVDVHEHIAQLEREGAALARGADRAGWDAPVPATRWRVRDLVAHIGGVHRWAADIVRTAARTGGTDAGRAVGTGPGDAELLAWFREGHADLVAALRAAPDDLDCFAFLPAPSPLAFWARRQAHETAVHRADAEAAAGRRPTFDTAFAQDGMSELLLGFAARRSNAIATPGVIALRPSDGGSDWSIRLGGERIAAEPVPDGSERPGADATVTGTSGDIYLWLWNRPSAVQITGDTALADAWRGVRVTWG